jgi:hypothetical protein
MSAFFSFCSNDEYRVTALQASPLGSRARRSGFAVILRLKEGWAVLGPTTLVWPARPSIDEMPTYGVVRRLIAW